MTSMTVQDSAGRRRGAVIVCKTVADFAAPGMSSNATDSPGRTATIPTPPSLLPSAIRTDQDDLMRSQPVS